MTARQTALDLEPRRVLLVEDDPDGGEAMVLALTLSRWAVTLVPACAEVAAALLQPHDVALVDLMLVDGSGWDVARQIRVAQPSMPIVIYSGCDVRDGDPRLATVDACYLKPTRASELMAAMSVLIEKSRKRRP